MANTVNADLIWEILNDEEVTSLGTMSAPWLDFSYRLDLEPKGPKAQINVPYVTAGSTTLTNPSNFESGNSTIGDINVSATHYSQPFHLTQDQMNSGLQLKWLVKKNVQVLRNALVDAVFAPVTNANFGADVVDVVSTSFGTDDLVDIWAACKDFPIKNLWLDGSYVAELIPTNTQSFNVSQMGFQGAFGFDSIKVHNRWSGAGTNIIGFCAADAAIAVGTAFPRLDALVTSIAGAQIESVNVTVEHINLPVQFNVWVNTAGRVAWASMDVMLGAAAADTNCGKVVGNGS